MSSDEEIQRELIASAHETKATIHPGRDKTFQLLRPKYYWPGMYAMVERYCQNCHTCYRNKRHKDRTPGLLQSLPVPDRPWQHITMDFKSIPKAKLGFNKVLVVMCRLAKNPITIPCYKSALARDLA